MLQIRKRAAPNVHSCSSCCAAAQSVLVVRCASMPIRSLFAKQSGKHKTLTMIRYARSLGFLDAAQIHLTEPRLTS